jgi:predicted DNA-binding WGR domain protein
MTSARTHLAGLTLAALLAATPAFADFSSCVAGLRSQALSQGISGETFDAAFKGVTAEPKVIELMNNQPEFKTPIWDYLAALTDDGLEPLPPLPTPALALVHTATALLGVGPRGEVSSLDMSQKTWTTLLDATLPPRKGASVGVDPATGRVLLVGGDPPRGSTFHKDAWLFDGAAWTEVTAKGARPTVAAGRVAYHPRLGAWTLVGGHDNKYRSNEKLWLCDGKKWSSHPLEWRGAPAPDPRWIALLAWDPTSAQMLLVADDRLWLHAGDGTFRAITRFAQRPAVLAYDDRARRLYSTSDSQDWRVDLGPILDAHATPTAAAPAPTTKPPRPRAPEPEALPPQVWLRLQDGESDKFWFAALKGRSWTVRWGRRGALPKEQRKDHDSATEARAAYEKQVRAKLKAGYAHAPEREDAARIPGRTAWDMVLGAKGDDLFGGVPPGFDAKNWPVCADCRHPMQFIALFHADRERLPLGKAAALAVFACNGHFTSGACETWEADAGCNAAILLTAKQLARPALDRPPNSADGEKPIPPMRRRMIGYRPRHEADPELEDNAAHPAGCSKLGGFPAWLQFPDAPECDACGEAMQFVGQIDERADAKLNFGGGIAYVFRCPHGARFLWQR